ncbi:hypothetical protein SETIT_2G248800v2 [Setaria italica]|uniref:ATP-dependent DNA helicase n=1 Tax=Setaria italica TaxID=4555 RepID=A0A368Q2B1_SETIT|nr:hypothetical protein SETIT_2G248800v2 [Setaria italica]
MRLRSSSDADARHFHANIRFFNGHFSFTSLYCHLDRMTTNMRNSVVYTFHAHGQIYHNIRSFGKEEGTELRHLELYFHDDDLSLEYRYRKCREECLQKDKEVIERLVSILRGNPYSKNLRPMGQIEHLEDYQIALNLDQQLDQRTYNVPTTSEVAAVWIEGSERPGQFDHSVLLQGKDRSIHGIISYQGCYDALSYPLFFPRGELEWHNNIPKVGVTMDQVKATVAIRAARAEGEGGDDLGNQFAVDTYIKIESSHLDYIRTHQDDLRADLYQGLVDSLHAGKGQGDAVGKRTVLCTSFIGGPLDEASRYGKLDIFLTMTCNPSWDEIKNKLYPDQTTQDHPDLVTRVFRAKLEELKTRLMENDILGKVKAYVYVVEFQRRGLRHAHWLLIMKRKYKLMCPEQHDLLVSTELPDKNKYSEMYKMVTKHMMHGLNPNCPCTKGRSSCNNRYPHPFCETTSQGKDSYPIYKRSDNGRKEWIQGHVLDSQWVVPYNTYLLRTFNCHINVEACGSIKYVKYLFKYIYNGYDRASVAMREGDKLDDKGNVDEIKQYRDARWLQLHIPDMHMRCRKRKKDGQVGRVVSAHPGHLRTVDGVIQPTFREATERRGLIEEDNMLDDCLTEAAEFQMPSSLRQLFATIWYSIFEEASIEQNIDEVALSKSLNKEQRVAYDEIMFFIGTNQGGMFFVDGLGGTGKILLYRALLANV